MCVLASPFESVAVIRYFGLLVFLVGGCGPSADPGKPTQPITGSSQQATFPIAITDGLGRTITIDRPPDRIVSLSPTHTETLFAVGAGPSVVAVTTMDSYPEAVRMLPKAGGFAPNTINPETILSFRPNIVFVAGLIQEPVIETLSRAGLTVIAHEPTDFESAATMIEQVGLLTGHAENGAAIAADFRARVAAVRDRTAAIPASDRPRVFYALWDDPLQTTSDATFVGQMIAAAGGINIFGDSPQHYPRIGDEVVLDRNPDLIISPDHGSVGLPGRLASRPGWDRLSAVRAGRVYTVPEDLVNRSGPRLVEGLEAIEKRIEQVREVRKQHP